MRSKILLALILLSCLGSSAQKKIMWQDLAKVTFDDQFFPDYGQSFLYPTFSPSVEALEGEEVAITGYFLDIDPQGKMYILSKGPMSSCFFCGMGGPETAVELQFTSEPTFMTDDLITVTGILKLNSEDVEHFNYILTKCEGELAQ